MKDTNLTDKEFLDRTGKIYRDVYATVLQHVDIKKLNSSDTAVRADEFDPVIQALLEVVSKISIDAAVSYAKQSNKNTLMAVEAVGKSVSLAFNHVFNREATQALEEEADLNHPSNA